MRLLAGFVLVCIISAGAAGTPPPASRPNIVVVLTDDQGDGDLSSYGHATINTPNIERMAHEGIRLTSFFAAPSCTHQESVH